MGQNIPDWLTADFLKSCLQSDGERHQEITVKDVTFEPAVPAGNNYGSNLIRAGLQYSTQDDGIIRYPTSLIVKIMLDGVYKENMGVYIEDVFQREPKYYKDFISEAYKLCNFGIVPVPKYYKSSNPNCLVLEDLKVSGFQMVDRHKLLDFNHCQLYVKASARLHALSIAVHKTNPELIESLGTDSPAIAKSNMEMFKVVLKCSMQCMAAFLEDKPKYKECMELIKEMGENEALWFVFGRENPNLKALTQGDPWCTNMMFKYNSSGEAIDIKLIDFQSLKFTSPLDELLTFMLASAHPTVQKTKQKDLYHLYCDSLNSSLEELGCSERLSFEDLMAEIVSQSPFKLAVLCTLVPICLADETADLGSLFSVDVCGVPLKERSFFKLFQGKHFNEYILQILDQLIEEGVFDYTKKKMQKPNLWILYTGF